MTFQIGKVYRHTTGTKMKIIGRLKTYMWGDTLIGEMDTGQLQPVSDRDSATVNWEEVKDHGPETLYPNQEKVG